MKKLTRGGSLNLGRDPKKRDGFRSASFRSRSTSRKEGKSDDADSIKKCVFFRHFKQISFPFPLARISSLLLSHIDLPWYDGTVFRWKSVHT